MRIGSWVAVLLASSTIASCGNPPPPTEDAGTTDGGGPQTCAAMIGSLSFAHSTIGVVPTTSRHPYLDTRVDAPSDLVVNLTASAPGVVDFPASLTIGAGHSRALVRVT